MAQENASSPFDFMTTQDKISIRYGVWPCGIGAARGRVLILNGRTEFMEKYDETITDLNRRGFDVYSFDWRGQGLSTRLLSDRHKGYIRTYDDYLKDLELFVGQIVKPKTRSHLIVLAHSMGAHIALRFLHDHPEVFDQAVLVSPMIDILPSPIVRPIARFVTRRKIKGGLDSAYVFNSGGYNSREMSFKGNRFTSDPVRFMDQKKEIEKNPDLALGGLTYGWLEATFESIDILKKSGYAGQIKIPVLIVSAGSDKVIAVKAQKNICSAMANCQYIVISNARHEILKETDSIRSNFWDAFDRFTEH
ncbi:MAG: alpha/beta hydrolase [Deltaproteobacteria bacterium]|nr:alpha/beta hydrolase [Deltaproteobacteria bacterium]MBW2540073.1 alpha/beta hydrolase [Deltaproteobacteria bacterium]